MADDTQQPEGYLLGRALNHSGLSTRQAAKAAKLSEARLRQIIKGYQSAGRGQTVTVIGPASTIARIALVLDVTPEDLEGAGRTDAAAVLRTLHDVPAAATGEEESELVAEARNLTPEQRHAVLQLMRQFRRPVDQAPDATERAAGQ